MWWRLVLIGAVQEMAYIYIALIMCCSFHLILNTFLYRVDAQLLKCSIVKCLLNDYKAEKNPK